MTHKKKKFSGSFKEFFSGQGLRNKELHKDIDRQNALFVYDGAMDISESLACEEEKTELLREVALSFYYLQNRENRTIK